MFCLAYLDDLAPAEHGPHEPSDSRGITTNCIPVWMSDSSLMKRYTAMFMLRPPPRIDIDLLSGRLTVCGEVLIVILVLKGLFAGALCSANGLRIVFDCLYMKRCSENRSL